MMIGLSRLIRAIADVPKGGMQTGSPKVVLKLADAERIKAELEGVISERDALAKEVDAANDRNAELTEERDALAAQVEALRSAIEPFATGGVCSAIDREDYSIMRERIKDWHGVIQFKKAQDAYNSTPRQCLRDVQAEAVSKFAKTLTESLKAVPVPRSDYEANIKMRDVFINILDMCIDYPAATQQQGGE